MEEGLSQIHQELETALSKVSDGLAVLDNNWCYTFFSEQAERLIGMSSEELLGKCLWDLFPKVEGTRFAEGYRRAVATGQPVRFEEFYPAPLNLWLECHCYPSSGGLAVYFRDVTERKKAEEERLISALRLEKESRIFDTVLSSIVDFAYTFDLEGRFIYVNQALLNLWGLRLEDAVGKNFFDLKYPEELAETLQSQIQQVIRTGERLSGETPYTSPTGAGGYYEYIFSPVFREDGVVEIVAGSTRDITGRKELEQRITIQAQELAEQSRRKDEFLAMLSHELRNPLAPIRAAVDLLNTLDNKDEHPIQRRAREIIDRQVGALTKLIEDLLDVSRVLSGRVHLDVEILEVRHIVGHALQTVGPHIEQRRHSASFVECDEPFLVQADPTRLEEVLINLLHNAAKYTPEGGKIEVVCSRKGENAEIKVIDNGIGIERSLLPHIFDLFTQAQRSLDRSEGGLGIGLSLAHRLVEMHGGSLHVASPPKGREIGSEFIVRIPLSNAREVEPKPKSEPSPLSFDGLRVLVVEDNVDLANLLATFLEGSGAHVQCVHSGAEGLAAAKASQPDVVLLDIGLPGIDGLKVAKGLRVENTKKMRLIAMTGYGRDSDIALAKEAGFDGHMTKPFNFQDLVALLSP